jgi:ParB family chromosome partitioning protein
LSAIIAECDENLQGTNLTSAERALFTNQRKEAYEQLHPETKHGENQHTRSRKVCDSTSPKRFSEDTAEKTGRSERIVQLEAERGEKVSEELLTEIAGTDLDKGVVLDRIARLLPR